MTRLKGFLAAAAIFFAVGCFLFGASRAEAYGGGLQKDKYPQVLVKENFVVLSEQKLNEELKKIGETRKSKLTLTRAPQTMRCPAGKLRLNATLPRALRYSGLNPVYVSVYVNEELFRKVTCYYRLSVYDKVVVANHDLALEKEIVADDLRVDEREIEGRAEEYLTDVKDAFGKVPSRVIKEGTPLTKNMLQNPLVVEAGAPIKIVSDRKGIRIETDGVALMRGRVGSVIRVRNANSRKVMRGRIIDASTVEIL